LEWQKVPGEIQACGGIFMVRASAFQKIDGFRIDVMAAEDDELCLRMRRSGLKIISIAHDMVFHDAAITQFSQWWTRAKRTGMAYAQGAALHGQSADKHFTRQYRRAWVWAFGLPAISLSFAVPTLGLSLLGFWGYPFLATKIYLHGRRRGWSRPDAGLMAISNVISKMPELQGIIHYHYRTRWQRRHVDLIEYKGLKDS
jgi:GT2 family glycosyltransferase